MMIRSIPPASAHLALKPVPAPPPISGAPVATFLRNPSRISLRDRWYMVAFPASSRGRCEQREQLGHGGVGECRVVDMLVADDDAGPGVSGQPAGQGPEKRGVRRRVVERLAGGVERGDP